MSLVTKQDQERMLSRNAIEAARAHAETFFSTPAPDDAFSAFRRNEEESLRSKTERLRLARLAAEASRQAAAPRAARRRAA